MKLSCRLFIYP